MIATDRDGRFQIAAPHQLVDSFAHLGAFAVTEPADSRRQTLELHPVTRQTQPAIQRLVFRKKFEREIVGFANVIRIARECDPAKRPFAFAKKRTDVFRDKAGNLESVFYSGVESHLP